MTKIPIRMQNRMRALKSQVARFNAQIREETKRPSPDWLRMRALKVAKLKAKDQMARIIQRSMPSTRPGVA